MIDATASAALFARKKTRLGRRASTTRQVHQRRLLWKQKLILIRLSLIKQMPIEKMETLKLLDRKLAEIVRDEELQERQRTDKYKERIYIVLAKLNKAVGPITAPRPTTAARTDSLLPAEHQLPAETSHSVTEPRIVPNEAHPLLLLPRPPLLELSKSSLPHFRVNLKRWCAFS